MLSKTKMDLIEKLDNLVSLQKDYLASDNWDGFNKIEIEIRQLEESIVVG